MSEILKILARGTGIGPSGLISIINAAPNSYKTFNIPKRSGGYREISQPSTELKIVQRALVTGYLSRLPCHNAATAYRIGLSLRDNARPHAGHGPIAKFDFKDFFPSITERDWESYCASRQELSDFDVSITKRLLFKRSPAKRLLRLSIGAPSSPILSNILMYNFDDALSRMVESDHVTYTRYADDMTFSAPRVGHLNSVRGHIRRALRAISHPKLTLNHDKTRLVTTKYSRRVTGLVLTNGGEVTIGRDRKRWIRAAIDHYQRHIISIRDREVLTGLLAFSKSADPDYFISLNQKYGKLLIDEILRIPARRGLKRGVSRYIS